MESWRVGDAPRPPGRRRRAALETEQQRAARCAPPLLAWPTDHLASPAPTRPPPPPCSYYTYTGSLTTPPCSEGVMWHVSSAWEAAKAAGWLLPTELRAGPAAALPLALPGHELCLPAGQLSQQLHAHAFPTPCSSLLQVFGTVKATISEEQLLALQLAWSTAKMEGEVRPAACCLLPASLPCRCCALGTPAPPLPLLRRKRGTPTHHLPPCQQPAMADCCLPAGGPAHSRPHLPLHCFAPTGGKEPPEQPPHPAPERPQGVHRLSTWPELAAEAGAVPAARRRQAAVDRAAPCAELAGHADHARMPAKLQSWHAAQRCPLLCVLTSTAPSEREPEPVATLGPCQLPPMGASWPPCYLSTPESALFCFLPLLS